MDRGKTANRLNLDEDAVVYNNVKAIADIEAMPFIHKWQGTLSFGGESPLRKFPAQAFAVRRLEQSRPEVSMYFDGSGDDLPCERIPLCSLCLCGYALVSWREEPRV